MKVKRHAYNVATSSKAETHTESSASHTAVNTVTNGKERTHSSAAPLFVS